MKALKLLTLLTLLSTPARAALPLFLGDANTYLTNTGTEIHLVRSNVVILRWSTTNSIPFHLPTIFEAPTLWQLSTNDVFSDGTNHVIDFNLTYSVVWLTNDFHAIHSTNRRAGVWSSAVRKLYTGQTNRLITFNSAWDALGATTNDFLAPSNSVAVISIGSDGESETNNAIVIVSQ